MSTKKKTRTKSKSKTKKSINKKSLPKLSKEAYYSIFFVIAIIIVIFSILQMGVIGRFFDSLFKYLFGNFSYIIYLMLIAAPIYYIMNKKLNSPIIVASCLLFIDFLFQLILIGSKNLDYISFASIYNNNVVNYGGGLISYYPVKLLIYLLSYYGSLLVIISAIITLIFLYLNKNHRDFVLKIKYHVTNAFDKNVYEDDSEETIYNKEFEIFEN